MNGVLVVDKPVGPSSHDVVATARRALGTRRIGHTGTLDPLASGVLPLVVGQATRLARYLTGDIKQYEAEVTLGARTPTYDAASTPEPGRPVTCDTAGLERALAAFRGVIRQRPPIYSAKKVAGTRAYELARRGSDVALQPVQVEVHALDLLDFRAGVARLSVVCSAGFYVRSLAHDLGEALGCGAYLSALRRTRAGAFGLDEAVTLDALVALGPAAATRLVPLRELLPGQPAVTLTTEGVRKASHGVELGPRDLRSPWPAGSGPVRLLDEQGELVGLAERDGPDVLHAGIVLG